MAKKKKLELPMKQYGKNTRFSKCNSPLPACTNSMSSVLSFATEKEKKVTQEFCSLESQSGFVDASLSIDYTVQQVIAPIKFNLRGEESISIHSYSNDLHDVTSTCVESVNNDNPTANFPIANNYESSRKKNSVSESEITLPSNKWVECMLLPESRPHFKLILAELDTVEEIPVVMKYLSRNFLESTVTLCDPTNTEKENLKRFDDITELSKILEVIEGQTHCYGIRNSAFANVGWVSSACYQNDVWRSKDCKSLANSKGNLCDNCKRLFAKLKMRVKRSRMKTKNKNSAKMNHAHLSHEDLRMVVRKQAKRIKILERWKNRAMVRLKDNYVIKL